MKDSFNVIKQISLKVFKGFLGIISEPSKGSFIKKNNCIKLPQLTVLNFKRFPPSVFVELHLSWRTQTENQSTTTTMFSEQVQDKSYVLKWTTITNNSHWHLLSVLIVLLICRLTLSGFFRKTRLVLSGKITANRPLKTTTTEKRTECQLVNVSKTPTCKSTYKLQSATFHLRFIVTVNYIKGWVTTVCVSHIQIWAML